MTHCKGDDRDSIEEYHDALEKGLDEPCSLSSRGLR